MHLSKMCIPSFSSFPRLTFLSLSVPSFFLRSPLPLSPQLPLLASLSVIYLPAISSAFYVPPHISVHPDLSFHLPFLLFHPLCLPCSPAITGSQVFPEHIVASQRKLAQHSAINNWRGPTWPGTLSLNGLFWERSMPACEGFIRACRWNVQGHRQYSLLSVLILPCSSVTSYTPPPSLCLQYPPAPRDEPIRPQKDHGQRHTTQFLIKLHKH